MNILLLTIPVTFLISGAFLAFFLWAVRRGQFDDTTTPAIRILNDENEREELS